MMTDNDSTLTDNDGIVTDGDSIMTDNIVLQCPQCKKPVPWNSDYPHRPFCSARCRRLDFGDWANEHYRIAGEAAGDDFSADERERED